MNSIDLLGTHLAERGGLGSQVTRFLNHLPSVLVNSVVEDFVNYLETGMVNRGLGSILRERCDPGSQLTKLPNGNWQLTEKIYSDDYSGNFFDRYIIGCKSGRATNDRLRTIIEEVSEMIGKEGATEVWSLGSGNGRDVISIAQRFEELTVKCFDADCEGLSAGERLAERRGLSNRIEFIKGDFRKTIFRTDGQPQIALMIGIVCPMDLGETGKLLSFLRKRFLPGTLLVVSTALDHMLKEDPFSCYLINASLGWKLCFKRKEDFRTAVEEAGYLWEEIFTDKYGYHGMALCRVP